MIDTKDLLNSRRIEYGTKSNLALYTKVDSITLLKQVAWRGKRQFLKISQFHVIFKRKRSRLGSLQRLSACMSV